MISVYTHLTSQESLDTTILYNIAVYDERPFNIQFLAKKTVTLRRFRLTKAQMLENGFPVIMFNQTHIEANEYQQNRKMFFEENDTTRVCNRCSSQFTVETDGFQTISQDPVCQNIYKFHIHDQQPVENLKHFKKSPQVNQFNTYMSGSIFALDVEMVYTSHGQEVGRVTLVNFMGAAVVDMIVRPKNKVYDPVTKFSGLTKQMLARACYTVEMARDRIFGIINEETILVGHGLYGDLKALGIIHFNVIDTSVLYTNDGRRPSLRYLSSTHLKKKIQNRGRQGHCSKEDAVASLELVYYGTLHPEALAPMYRPCQ